MDELESLPGWIIKLTRRLLSLQPGRYSITLTVGKRHDWTVQMLGKVEE
jgi:hypothetical protein